MPTSNGFDRNNYNTTTFTKKKLNRQKSEPNVEVRQSHDSRTDYSHTGSHRTITNLAQEQRIYTVQPDPSYIYIQDPKLRELILVLIKSEAHRSANNVDPSILTQVDHKDYSLLFSKTGPSALTNVIGSGDNNPKESKSIQTEILAHQIQSPQPQIIVKMPPKNQSESFSQTDQIHLEPENKRLLILHDETGNRFCVSEMFNENTGQLVKNPDISEIPTEVNKVIQKDLDSNPLEKGERSYKIVLNKNFSKPGQPPQVIRVLLKQMDQEKQLVLPKLKTNGFKSSFSGQNTPSSFRYVHTPSNQYKENSANYKVVVVKK